MTTQLPPLNTQSCQKYEKTWKDGLKSHWDNCTNNTPENKNPLWNELSDVQKQEKINVECCDEILQCKDPNTWLKNNNYKFRCPVREKPNFPHFGTSQNQSSTNPLVNDKLLNNLKYGVY
jgi:hypothetical protein